MRSLHWNGVARVTCNNLRDRGRAKPAERHSAAGTPHAPWITPAPEM